MGKIFERAYCTLAAVDAIDDDTGIDRGLFLPRTEDPLTVRLKCHLLKDPVKPERFQSPDGQPYCWKYTYRLDEDEERTRTIVPMRLFQINID
ncbi:uncharacterized protein BDZ99DRAFT_44040 [Mytilinidion resinicola]|uniref:Uncharacterized protein n=1 Tax=Mytilinidion resinicola TaxID=574789 RepID=A0A6A6YM35_9PEZI|nr:uncharacterized protein BDZ99DRAFT_44040 [Mytilinidion resinicola]KAF2809044.1 hypothetical protein BDZ99DRAFT_44040 [Mytilinidion resinicola]